MSSASFIPLGDVNHRAAFEDSPHHETVVTSLSTGGEQKKQTLTKDDRKRIAEATRRKTKDEKRKTKADAKKERKENAILHRRMNRNNEKLVKNKDRNKQRSIDLERSKIQRNAVQQAERMAAKYDLTGKLFNVGEVVITPDGKVKSKTPLQKPKDEKAKEETLPKAESRIDENAADGINPQRRAQISGLLTVKPAQQLDNKHQKGQETLPTPKPVLLKPVLPEGYNLPEDEENFIALWDITDEGILKRLSKQKKEKTRAAKLLRNAQQEKKKLNRAMKAMKKEANNKNIVWDPEAARKLILGEAEKNGLSSKSGSKSDDDDDASSASDEEWESDDDTKPKAGVQGGVDAKDNAIATQNFPNRPKIKMELLKVAEDNERQLAERKRQARSKRKQDAQKKTVENAPAEEKTKADELSARKAERKAAKKEAEVTNEVVDVAPPVVDDKSAKKAAKVARKAEKAAKRAAEEAGKGLPVEMEGVESTNGLDSTNGDNKKRKRKEDAEDDSEVVESKSSKKSKVASTDATHEETSTNIQNGTSEKKSKKSKKNAAPPVPEVDEEELLRAEEKERKKEKKARKAAKLEAEAAAAAASVTKSSDTAQQWNPDALTGDAARKDKYLRLLGAKKGGSSGVVNGDDKRRKNESGSGKVDDIRKAESELERQFQAGIKMKHDGGGKRRGLGA